MLEAGCSNPLWGGREVARPEEIYVPKVPLFLNGPVAVLLTNGGGFQARVTMECRGPSNRVEVVSGDLMGQGTTLLFAPGDLREVGKTARDSGMRYLWDVAQNRGYMVSETMQAYALVSSAVHVTNVLTQVRSGEPAWQKVDGKRCEAKEVVVLSSDGSALALEVWEGIEVNKFPLWIVATNIPFFTLNLSDLVLAPPSPELFYLPEDFAQYPNEEALVSELMIREENLLRHGFGRSGYHRHGRRDERYRFRDSTESHNYHRDYHRDSGPRRSGRNR
jgi:hypothetical protein